MLQVYEGVGKDLRWGAARVWIMTICGAGGVLWGGQGPDVVLEVREGVFKDL
jgi:hypothetical protein